MCGKDHPLAIKFDKNRTIYPYILAKDLQEHLKQISLEDVTSETLYKELKRINRQYALTKPSQIPGVRKKLTKQAVERAKSSGFFLGLDEQWHWLGLLEENLQFKS